MNRESYISDIELSIIVPIYNTAQYLPQCIESIYEQTFKNWELILVDDGSNDGSSEICDKWCKKDSRIKVIHKQNTGQADSRNEAINICRGNYIGFVDSDDWIEPNMYEILIKEIKETHSDIAICNHYEDSKNKSFCKKSSDKKQVIKGKRIQELIIQDRIKSYIWQMIFKQEFVKTPMPTNKNYEDYCILPQWFQNVRQIIYIPQPLYHYRLRKSSIVHSLALNRFYEFFQAEKYRYKYYAHSPFQKIAKKMVARRGIKTAKYISRISQSLYSQKEVKAYIIKISNELKSLQKDERNKMSYKERFLLFLLLKHPNRFIQYQRIAQKVTFYKHSHLDLYD